MDEETRGRGNRHFSPSLDYHECPKTTPLSRNKGPPWDGPRRSGTTRGGTGVSRPRVRRTDRSTSGVTSGTTAGSTVSYTRGGRVSSTLPVPVSPQFPPHHRTGSHGPGGPRQETGRVVSTVPNLRGPDGPSSRDKGPDRGRDGSRTLSDWSSESVPGRCRKLDENRTRCGRGGRRAGSSGRHSPLLRLGPPSSVPGRQTSSCHPFQMGERTRIRERTASGVERVSTEAP